MPKLKQGAIRRLREQKCWSQEELARRAGVSTRTLQRAESGASAKADTVAYVAEALEVPPNELVEEQQPADAGASPQRRPTPIPVVLHRITEGKVLLSVVQGAEAMMADTRGLSDREDAGAIGALLDGLRDYVDVGSDFSYADQLRYGVQLDHDIRMLQERGWWILAGRKRHALVTASVPKPIPWTTAVVLAARADDSIVVHREDGEPVALVALPQEYNLA
ncbi:MAG: helix-turn-helix transcriptional regulator [Planctomycetota bacterium]